MLYANYNQNYPQLLYGDLESYPGNSFKENKPF